MSLLSTSTEVVMIDNIFNQKTISTREFTLKQGMPNSWQVAYPIQIRWRAADFQTHASTTAASEARTESSIANPSATTTDTDSLETSSHTSPKNESHLSTGAIIGIALGAFFFALVLAAAVSAYILIRRKRGLQSSNSTINAAQLEYAGRDRSWTKSELDSQAIRVTPAAELPGNAIQERFIQAELDGAPKGTGR
jgi:hypothetical protein